jgi:predicted GNAT family N-acyltransferase
MFQREYTGIEKTLHDATKLMTRRVGTSLTLMIILTKKTTYPKVSIGRVVVDLATVPTDECAEVRNVLLVFPL